MKINITKYSLNFTIKFNKENFELDENKMYEMALTEIGTNLNNLNKVLYITTSITYLDSEKSKIVYKYLPEDNYFIINDSLIDRTIQFPKNVLIKPDYNPLKANFSQMDITIENKNKQLLDLQGENKGIRFIIREVVTPTEITKFFNF